MNRITKMLTLLALTLCLATTAYAQQAKDKTVTLDLTQVTVKQFFAEVKKQTGLNFMYSAELAKSFPKGDGEGAEQACRTSTQRSDG